MTGKRRPGDPIQRGKLIVDIAIGTVPDGADNGKDVAAAMGRKGGGGRAASMTPKRRAEIAKKAAAKRRNIS